MKNGSLPTFRKWRNQTQRVYPGLSKPSIITPPPQKPPVIETIPKNNKRRKILKRNFTIGKYSNRPKVGILVSNKTLRKNVTTKQKMIQQTPLDDIKNHNPDNLLYNYLNSNDNY